MTTLAEAVVIAAITLAPFALALLVATAIVQAIGERRLARWLRLDLGDER